jgi:hypothetical protein
LEDQITGSTLQGLPKLGYLRKKWSDCNIIAQMKGFNHFISRTSQQILHHCPWRTCSEVPMYTTEQNGLFSGGIIALE